MFYRQGSIVILPVPFTDLTARKQRPCLIISRHQSAKTEDVIVLAITSNPNQKHVPDSFAIDTNGLGRGFLPKESYVKLTKVFTLSKSLIRKEVGALRPEIFSHLLKKFLASFI